MDKNAMAEMPVKKLMFTTGVPVVFSMTFQAVYNIVDSAFVANMDSHGEEGLNALTLAFPIQMLMVAGSIGLGIGASVVFAKNLGQKNYKRASEVAGNGIFLSCISALIFLLFGLLGVQAYINSQTGNEIISAMAMDYLGICCIFSFGGIFFGMYEKLLQATGRS